MFSPGEISVQKFGGSSLSTPERIFRIAERIAEQVRSGRRAAIVVSATGDSTDELISLLQKITRDPDPRELDQLMATGEMVSGSLMASALKNLGIPSQSFNAFNLGIVSSKEFGSAEIREFRHLPRLARLLQSGGVPIVCGFQGVTPDGDLTTLGRGGSDITAVALARDLGQKVCEKFTDEDGIYSGDPRLLQNARKIWHLNYDEMETLARFGNGILHPRSVSYAREANIRIHVRSSFSCEEGSIVGPDGDSSIPVKSLAFDRKQAVVEVRGFPRERANEISQTRIQEFRVLSAETGLDGTGSSFWRVGFKIAEAFEALPKVWQLADGWAANEVCFNSRLAMITLVGEGLRRNSPLVTNFVDALQKISVQPLLAQHEGIRFTVAVEEIQADSSLKALHSLL